MIGYSAWKKKINEEFRLQTRVSSLIKTQLRGYQLGAVQRCFCHTAFDESETEPMGKGLIVVLPTGSGKTLIASAVAALDLEMEKHEKGEKEPSKMRKVLFLVPTCLLVQQSARAMREAMRTSILVAEFQGGSAVPSSSSFHILVSTPSAYLKLCHSEKYHDEYGYHNFIRIIFDEVHHVVKKHPYRKIAKDIHVFRQRGSLPLILGLTASLTYAVDPGSIKGAIIDLCSELDLPIDDNPLFVVSDEELQADGYQIPKQSSSVLPWDFNMSVNNIDETKLQLPGKSDKWVDFMGAYEEKKLHALSSCFMYCIKKLERQVKVHDPTFNSRIDAAMVQEKKKMAEWCSYANQRAKMYTNTNPTLSCLYISLEHMYEALKLLINSRQTALELAMYFLEMTETMNDPNLQQLHELWQIEKHEFCRIAQLKEILINEKAER